jgi:hypothetical protein
MPLPIKPKLLLLDSELITMLEPMHKNHHNCFIVYKNLLRKEEMLIHLLSLLSINLLSIISNQRTNKKPTMKMLYNT